MWCKNHFFLLIYRVLSEWHDLLYITWIFNFLISKEAILLHHPLSLCKVAFFVALMHQISKHNPDHWNTRNSNLAKDNCLSKTHAQSSIELKEINDICCSNPKLIIIRKYRKIRIYIQNQYYRNLGSGRCENSEICRFW